MELQGSYLPFIVQAKVFNPVLPIKLSRQQPPIKLTQLSFDVPQNIDMCVFISFSGFVSSNLRGEDFNRLTFRLIKKCEGFTVQNLQEYSFRRGFVNDTNIKEPVVYNYCQCISNRFISFCTYSFELVEAELSNNSFYNISEKNMTAQVYRGEEQHQGRC
ncbi:DUF4489 domain-containing protein [Bacillus carboniphilus]|uniref:DUF4489 domain-containing protein n=1 Tax=Bacillus carboniphilus TaxID=86663 RepID=A0ABY9JSS1_9BACI|nr:DUF4489 domain-containing protein [Bacillus carboniphilus]WLR42444.1 DUF4489 domain-containing protein [Bacillus carboniphilus]